VVALHGRPGEPPALLRRPANWNVDTHGYGGQRTPAVRLLQPALMNYALAFQVATHATRLRADGIDPGQIEASFDPRTDAYTPSGGAKGNGGIPIARWKQLNEGGLSSAQGNTLLEHLTGLRYRPVTGITKANRAAVTEQVLAALRQGRPVPIGVAYVENGHQGGHQMMADHVDPRTGQVHVIDPIDGSRHVWSRKHLEGAITDANLPV
jgi:hypothetical protein